MHHPDSSPPPPVAIVVNDDAIQLALLSGFLCKEGITSLAYTGPEAALAALNPEKPPNLIITDLNMPGIDGWRFCRLLRSSEYKAFNRVPVLVVSATFSGEEPDRIAADIGVDAFLPFPMDGRRFVQQVRAILEGRRTKHPLRAMIVADDGGHAQLLRQVFEARGYQAFIAPTARTAYDAFQESAFDAAVIDHHLPDGTGDVLMDAFRVQRPDCTCILMTADPNPALALDWVKRGAAAYLKKPFHPEYLMELCALARRERALLRVQELLEQRTRDLRESEEKFRLIAENTSDGILVISRDNQIGYVSPAYIKQLGYSEMEELGRDDRSIYELIHPEDRDELFRNIFQAIADGKTELKYAYRVRRKDGRYIWREDHARFKYDDEGSYMGAYVVCRDITERKQMEVNLTDQAEFARSIFNSTDAHIAVVGADGRILDANDAWRRFAEQNHAGNENVWGPGARYFREFTMNGEDAAMASKAFKGIRNVQEGRLPSFEMEYPCHSPDRQRWFFMRVLPMIGRPGAVVISHIDITARKQAEETFRKTEMRNKALLNALPDMMFVLNGDGVILDYHAPDPGLLLLKPAIFLGRRVHEVLSENIAEMTVARMRDIRENGRTTPYEYEAKIGDSIKYFEARMVPCDGNTFLSIVRDITEQKQAHDAKKLDEERLEALLRLNQMTDVSVDEIAHFAMEEAIRLTGSTIGYMAFVSGDEKILTMHAWSRTAMRECLIGDRPLIYPLETTGLWGEAVRRRRPVITNDYSAPNPWKKGYPSGHVEIRRHMNVPIFDGDKIVIVAGVGNKPADYDETDVRQLTLLMTGMWRIVQRRRTEEDREKMQDQLIQSQKMESIGCLAGGVAHDFNNMLSVILGHAELALELTDRGRPVSPDLREIRKAAIRSADLTRQLLAFARRQTIVPKALDLNETVADMLKMLRRLIGENIELVWKPGEGPCPLKMDPAQVDQILANLCVNARDAIDETGRVFIGTEIALLDASRCAMYPECIPGDYAMLTVSDDGCGMDRETMTRIFEPFFTTKEMGKGTGLGLATVYGIVRQNRGFIDVRSEPGQGTDFRIFLPVRRDESEPVRKEDSEKPVASGGHEIILVVEDEPAILEMADLMLKHLKYSVLAAATPGEAINLAGTYPGRIRLLMTDVVMPGMNGPELAQRLTSIHPGIKTLFMSGYMPDVIARHGVLDEGVRFIQKPFSMKELAAKVRDALDDACGGG